jgi:hypothetical protein
MSCLADLVRGLLEGVGMFRLRGIVLADDSTLLNMTIHMSGILIWAQLFGRDLAPLVKSPYTKLVSSAKADSIAAKAADDFARFTARLKPCPFKTNTSILKAELLF